MSLSENQRALVLEALAKGTRRGAEKLAALSNVTWSIVAETLSEGSVESLRAREDGGSQPHFGAYLPMGDGSSLSVLILFPAEDGKILARTFAPGPGDRTNDVPRAERHAVAEIANGMSHALIGALADALGALIVLAAPLVALGPRQSLMDAALDKFRGNEGLAVLSRISLTAPKASAKADVLVLVETDLLRRFFLAQKHHP